MKNIKEKIELLDKDNLDAETKEEIKRDLKMFGYFLSYYISGGYDETSNSITMCLPCKDPVVQEIEKYADECMDDFYTNKE